MCARQDGRTLPLGREPQEPLTHVSVSAKTPSLHTPRRIVAVSLRGYLTGSGGGGGRGSLADCILFSSDRFPSSLMSHSRPSPKAFFAPCSAASKDVPLRVRRRKVAHSRLGTHVRLASPTFAFGSIRSERIMDGAFAPATATTWPPAEGLAMPAQGTSQAAASSTDNAPIGACDTCKPNEISITHFRPSLN